MKARRAPANHTAQHVPGSLAHISAQLGAADELDEIIVWPELRAGWELFLRFLTQLRYAGMAGTVVGIDYTPVIAWLRDQHDSPARRDELLLQLQWCEAGLLQAVADAADEVKR